MPVDSEFNFFLLSQIENSVKMLYSQGIKKLVLFKWQEKFEVVALGDSWKSWCTSAQILRVLDLRI